MLKTRIIPCLDVANGRVVKGVNFVDIVDAGDPVETARAYDAAGADEICFLDIHATHENRGTMFDVVQRTAEQCYIPLTVGGGVRTTGGVRALLLAGADKVSIADLIVLGGCAAIEAAAKAGGLLSALPLQWRSKDVGYVKEITGARFYASVESFHGFDYRALGQELGFEHYIGLAALTDIAHGNPGRVPEVPVDANDIFTLCWTSGTESNPKGCPMSHNNWEYMTNLVFTTCGLREGDRILCVAPLVNMTAVMAKPQA